MRPNKPINSGAHRSGTASRTSKGRYYTTGLPTAPTEETEIVAVKPEPRDVAPTEGKAAPTESKYVGRASVGPHTRGEGSAEPDLDHTQWVDPLDDDDFDLTQVTIDLRPMMVEEPGASYYQRHGSRVPGHQ